MTEYPSRQIKEGATKKSSSASVCLHSTLDKIRIKSISPATPPPPHALMPYRRYSSDERFPLVPGTLTALVFFLPVRNTLADAAPRCCTPLSSRGRRVPFACLLHVSWVREHANLQGGGSHSFTICKRAGNRVFI